MIYGSIEIVPAESKLLSQLNLIINIRNR